MHDVHNFVARCNRVPSVYGSACVEILKAYRVGPFILQEEKIGSGDHRCIPTAAYTQEGYYVGDKQQAEFLVRKGITSQVQPRGDGTPCSIGFCPADLKWYGWSHRAIYGFGIGSSVKQGDCAFSPSSKEEIEASMLEFWDLTDPYAWRECEDETVVCKNRLFRSVQTRQEGVLGWLVAYDTIFIGADRHPVRTQFTPYPKKWGKGAWVAKTIEDAKQMAIDFSKGVS